MKKQRQSKKKLIIGITGSFASGKTSVARMFKSYGAYLIDADKIAHINFKPGTEAYRKLVKEFGQAILSKGKAVDRGKLAKIVFNNNKLLQKLNKIIHPAIIRNIKSRVKHSKKRIIVLDAPLLIEAGLRSIADKLIVVKANKEIQIKRAIQKIGISRKEALQRIRSQMPLSAKVRLADFVIDNNGRIEKSKKQVRAIRRLLWKS